MKKKTRRSKTKNQRDAERANDFAERAMARLDKLLFQKARGKKSAEREFVDKVMRSLPSMPVPPETIPADSTAFPSDWVGPYPVTLMDNIAAVGATAPDIRTAAEWLRTRSVGPQPCGLLHDWIERLGTQYIHSLRAASMVLAKRVKTFIAAWATNGDVIVVTSPLEHGLPGQAMDWLFTGLGVFCVVIPAAAVPKACETCQTNAALDRINVRVPEGPVRGPAPVN